MKNIKKLWITISSGGSFPFWETDITDNEELKNEYDDFKNSLCLVSYDDFKEEKEKVEKLKKCVEYYASLEHNSEAQSIEYDEPSFFFDNDDISTEIWTGKDHNGVERSYKGQYYGKLARLTLKELGE